MVSVFDLVNHKLLQQTGTGGKGNGGVLYTPTGKTLWVAQPGGLARFDVAAGGILSNQLVVTLPGVSGRAPVPAGLAWAANGTDLLSLSVLTTPSASWTPRRTLLSGRLR